MNASSLLPGACLIRLLSQLSGKNQSPPEPFVQKRLAMSSSVRLTQRTIRLSLSGTDGGSPLEGSVLTPARPAVQSNSSDPSGHSRSTYPPRRLQGPCPSPP